MGIKSSGSSLSFSEIISEFGPSSPTGAGNQRSRLGDHRLTTDYGGLTLTGVDSGVPGSGAIKFSDLYGKRLNVVVDYYNGGDQINANARNRYDNSTYGIVHGWKAKPSDTSDIKVHVVINKKMGVSSNSTRTNVAWRSGSWTSGTRFTVYVQGNSKIYGAGGDGGKGGGGPGSRSGTPGTNAMGFDFGPATINVASGAYIQKGYGGGNGGQANYSGSCNKNPNDPRNGGGGGGGGAGWYNGRGAPGGPGDGGGCDGGSGNDGTDTTGGSGGSGKNCGSCRNQSDSGEPGRSPTQQGSNGGNDGNCAIALAPGVSVSQNISGTVEGGLATGQTITTS